ncbi:MAG: rhodanese-like domain-containing protein [Acidobacteria bacterium]|nr:rhodanese-like domain-containing protein [Acidobacteriota bacterium]
MFDRRFFAEGAAIVVLAVLCASTSNIVAARERKLAPVGDYPRALEVPAKVADPAPAAAVAPATDESAISTIPEALETAATTTAAAPSTATPPQPALSTTPTTQVKLPAGVPVPPKPKKLFAPHPDVAYVEITNADAMQLWHEKAIFIDARRTDVFNQGHIAGSRSMPVWEADINDRIRAFFDEVTNQQQPIVVYCSGGNCEDSHMLADKLWGAGYENVLVYKDGFPAWQRMGGAVE